MVSLFATAELLVSTGLSDSWQGVVFGRPSCSNFVRNFVTAVVLNHVCLSAELQKNRM